MAVKRRRVNRLTAVAVRGAKPGMNPDGGNLYLQVSDSGAKSWLFRYGKNGRERYMGLGPLITIGLAQAREDATRCRALLLKGIDPIEARKAERAANAMAQHQGTTFRECADRLIAAHEVSWRGGKQAAQWRNSLAQYAYPAIGSVAVQVIDTALVLKVIEPVWSTRPETASRVRGRIEAVLDWAKARGIRTGDNPARWRGHLDHLLPARRKVRAVEHHPALPCAEVGTFMQKLRACEDARARALEFLVLTAARAGEVLGMRWEEVDLAAKTWTVPASRMKSGREHRVPLSTAALGVLKKPGKGLVFPASRGRPFRSLELSRVHRRLGYSVVTHGFRTTFREWAAERTSYPREVAEMALAHSVGSEVERAYARGDLFEKRRRLMDAWAEFCGKPEASKVVPIGRAAK